MLYQAFEALKTYDWGADKEALNPIEEAIIATRNDPSARQQLERRLAELLKTDVSRDARDYICRKLMLIGSAASVPALAPLLADANHSHMARFALERIPAPEAAQALREALAQVAGAVKVGVISSLAARLDAESVPALAALAGEADAAIARSAVDALGDIRTADAARALADVTPEEPEVKVAAIDAQLAVAEQLLADGRKTDALAIYKSVFRGDHPPYVRLAATRGMLACAGNQG